MLTVFPWILEVNASKEEKKLDRFRTRLQDERRRQNRFAKSAHMSNTLDQIPVDKSWSPTESSRKMKPEVQ